MKAEIRTKRYVQCPNGCEHQMFVEHLLSRFTEGAPRSAGPWYCDVCGQGWLLKYTAESVDLEAYDGGAGNKGFGHDGKQRRDWVILELPPQTEPVRFKVRGMRFSPHIDEDRRRYFYEEHTCPTNWLRDVEEVAIGDDTDPHGLWRLVSVYDADATTEPQARGAKT